MRYIQAILGYWGADAHNPESPHYAGRMIAMDRAHIWAWDTRPWPAFPRQQSLWSDAVNHARGHWLNGRAGQVSLAAVVAEICAYAGVNQVDTTQLYGALKGYVLQGDESARQALQPLMLAYGFDAIEQGGGFTFRTRDGRAIATLAPEGLVVEEDGPSPIAFQRAQAGASRVRLNYLEADHDYQSGAVEAAEPDVQTPEISQSGLPLVLGSDQAQIIVDRWLNEGRIARDFATFALPPSDLQLGAGDVVRLPQGEGYASYRIDRIEEMGQRKASAVRVEPGVYRSAPTAARRHEKGGNITAGPVFGMLLDLPLLREDDVPQAPYAVVASKPWPGAVAVLGAASDSNYASVGALSRSVTLGRTQQALPAAKPGRWNWSVGLEILLDTGQLQSQSALDVLGGANAATLWTGEDWEIIQFQQAELIAPMTYRLNGLLRGQKGTDSVMLANLPAGADFVLLDGAQGQVDFSLSQIGAERHYRVGPASKPFDDIRYHHLTFTHEGAGLRCYAPVHLRAARNGADMMLSWVRRGRINNDSWLAADIPLGEERESYRLRILVGGVVKRELSVSSPSFTYSAAQMAADGATSVFEFEIAQNSASIGAGLAARKTVNV